MFTSSAPTVAAGDGVEVTGLVTEFRPGGAAQPNLTTTELASPSITLLSSGNPLPVPQVVGAGGRVAPTMVIEDDPGGNVETGGVFDPAFDGIDFYESLEGMRVQVNNPVATGPTNPFGEISVLPDDGAGRVCADASRRHRRACQRLQPGAGDPRRRPRGTLPT